MKEGGTCGIGKQIGLLQHFASPFGHYLFPPVSLPAAAAAAVRSRSSVRSIRRCGQAENAKEGDAQLIRNSGGALVNLNKEPLDL